MNKKAFWIVAVIIVILIVLIIADPRHSDKNATAGKPIKIGMILPLTGDLGFMGEQMKVGSDLAAKKLNENGERVRLLYEDSQFDPRITASAANKLVSIDKADAAILFTVEEAKPVAPMFTAAKIPLMSAWDSNAFLRDAGQYVFSNGFSTERAGSLMADFAYDNLKLRKAAVLSHIDAWSEIVAKNFVDEFEKRGGSIVYNESVQVGTDNLRTHVSKIKHSGAEGVYFPLIPFDNQNFVKQAKENGLAVPLMTGDAFLPEVIAALGRESDGIYFSNGYAENPIAGLNIYAQVAYDAVMKIGVNTQNGASVKEALDKALGPTRTADRTEKIFQIKDAVPIPVK